MFGSGAGKTSSHSINNTAWPLAQNMNDYLTLLQCRTLLAELHPHHELIRGLALLEERQLLLSASNDGTVAVTDIRLRWGEGGTFSSFCLF